MATAFTSGFRWEVKQMLEIIANGSNTYPYQKSTLSDLYTQGGVDITGDY